MKEKAFKSLGMLILIAGLILTISGCGKKGGGGTTVDTFIPVTNITGIADSVTVGNYTLNGTVFPDAATNKTISWAVTTAGTTGASIVNANILRTTATGTVTVTATVENGASETEDYTKNFTITITPDSSYTSVTNIIDVPSAAITGVPLALTGTVVPSSANSKTISWSVRSAGTTGATVNENTLNTTGAGTVTITATIANGIALGVPYTKDFEITVSTTVTAVISITGVPSSTTVGTPLVLTGTVFPNNASFKEIQWSVTNTGTTGASISSGNILNTTAQGTAVVTATIVNGRAINSDYTQDFNITVNPLPNLTGVVTINGSPQEKNTLTANTSNLMGSGNISYQWQRASAADGSYSNISGATAFEYTLTNADVNRYIKVSVTRAGHTGTITSSAAGPVSEAPPGGENVQGTVAVSDGVANVEVSFTNTGALTVPSNGSITVTIDTTGGSYQSYQWFVDGIEIPNAVTASFTVNGSDYGIGQHRILAVVTRSGVPYSTVILFTVN